MLKNLSSSKQAIVIFRNLLLLCVFLGTTQAMAAVATFCFHRSSDLLPAIKEANTLILADETKFEAADTECMSGDLHSEDRVNFFENYLTKRFPISRTLGQLSAPTGQSISMCHLQVMAKSSGRSASRKLKVNTQLDAKAKQNEESSMQNFALNVSAGMPGSISFQGEELKVICRPHANDLFELDISRKNKVSSVSSSVTVQKAENFELGSIGQSTNTNQKEVGLSKGLELQDQEQQNNVTFTIKVE